MMYPILCKVQYEVLHRLFSHRGAWKQIGFSVFVNWVVAPLFMVRNTPSLRAHRRRSVLIQQLIRV